MAYIEWRRGEDEIAVRIQNKDVPWGNVAVEAGGEVAGVTKPGKPAEVVVDPDGIHRKAVKAVKDAWGSSPDKEKGVIVELGSRALFFINGRYEGELNHGAHRIDKLPADLKKELRVYHPTVVLVDAAETWLAFKMHELPTADDQSVSVFAQLAFKLVDPAVFFMNVMKSRENYGEAELRRALFQPLRAGIEQFARGRTGQDLVAASDQARQDLLVAIEGSTRNLLGRIGFEIVDVNVFQTEAALEAAARYAREQRREARQELADDKADDKVAGEEADWEHDKGERAHERSTRTAAQTEDHRRHDAEVNLDNREWQADHDQRSDNRELDDRRRRIDTWSRFAEEMIRKNVLDKTHSLQELDRLAQVAQDFKQLGVLRDEEWQDFQRDVDWKHLEQQWSDVDRKADRALDEGEAAEDRKQRAEIARRQRRTVLTKLDETLANEVTQLKMKEAASIDQLKLELARKRIEEQLGHDRVDEEARQELQRLVYRGKRQQQELDHGVAEQRLTFDERIAELKHALGTQRLRYEAEVSALQAEITLAAVDEAEAANLLARVQQDGASQQLDHDLDLAARKFEAALKMRAQTVDQQLDEQTRTADAARKAKLDDAKADADADAYADERDLDLLGRKQQLDRDAKWDKLERLKELAEIDKGIDDAELNRDLARKQADLDELKTQQQHETGLKKLEVDKDIKRMEAEVEALRVKATMGADQLEAVEGMEDARVEAHKAKARGDQRDYERQIEAERRDELRKDSADRDRVMQDMLDRQERAAKDAAERLERVALGGMDNTRRAGESAAQREADERARDENLMRERIDDLKDGRSEAIGAIKDVAQEKVTSPTVQVRSGGGAPCHSCGTAVTVSQPLCPNCGQPLK